MLACMSFVNGESAFTRKATVKRGKFGELPDGENAEIYTLRNSAMELRVMSFGARVVSLQTRDREGALGDIVLGYNTLEEYVADNKTYLGVIAGRYANRLARGRFTLDGKVYQVEVNDGPNTLHGGDGFDRRNWTGREIENGVEFSLISPDGEKGFPGTVTARVRYTLEGDTVSIEYHATTDKPTIINLTNHAYFNLAGEGNGTVLDHEVTIKADRYTPVDATLIPTGELAPAAGTPFDFTQPHAIGARIDAGDEQLKLALGYDHNYVLRGASGTLRRAARVGCARSGRMLEVQTTEPGVQFYSGNHLDGSFTGKSGVPYTKRTGFCLETQHFPDSPNHPEFPSTVLRPGETFDSMTTWTFEVEEKGG